MRVVLDTNVFIAALIKPGSTNDLLVRRWLDGAYALLTSEAQLGELRRVSREARVATLIRRGDAGRLINHLHRFAELIYPKKLPSLASDPDDDLILAIALTGKADYLASLDTRHLLVLEKVGKLRIVHARDLLERLG